MKDIQIQNNEARQMNRSSNTIDSNDSGEYYYDPNDNVYLLRSTNKIGSAGNNNDSSELDLFETFFPGTTRHKMKKQTSTHIDNIVLEPSDNYGTITQTLLPRRDRKPLALYNLHITDKKKKSTVKSGSNSSVPNRALRNNGDTTTNKNQTKKCQNKVTASCFFTKFIQQPISYMYDQWSIFNLWCGQSVMRCWVVLLLAMAVELYATILMKMEDEESTGYSALDDNDNNNPEGDDEIMKTDDSATDSTSDPTSIPTKYTVLSLVSYIISLILFGISIQQIDVGVAYAFWSAIGTATVAVSGIIWFDEPCTLKKSLSLVFIMLGVVGLNMDSNDE